jgi:hypothetical protein
MAGLLSVVARQMIALRTRGKRLIGYASPPPKKAAESV